MTLTLEIARDLWAARYGYEWHAYVNNPPVIYPVMSDPFWYTVMHKLCDNACLDINYVTGHMRLKEWKS